MLSRTAEPSELSDSTRSIGGRTHVLLRWLAAVVAVDSPCTGCPSRSVHRSQGKDETGSPVPDDGVAVDVRLSEFVDAVEQSARI